MSEGSWVAIGASAVTIVTTIVGFFTMWVKLHYNAKTAKDVENKLDANTALTGQAKEAATKASEHATTCNEERARMLKNQADHGARIASLEGQMDVLKTTVDAVSKNIDSTRHEMRTNMQTLMNKLDIIVLQGAATPKPRTDTVH